MRSRVVLRTVLLPTLLIGSLVAGAAPTTPDVAIAQYFTARFQAMDGSGPTNVGLIADSNPRLQAYAQRDLGALHALLASFHSPVGRSHQYRIDGRAGLRFKVYEQSLVNWNDGPNGVRTSSVGYAHTIDLGLQPLGGYLIVRDAYRGIGWDSPDVAPSRATAAGPEAPGRPNGFMRPNMTFGTYDRSAATTYVNTWWNSRNPAYTDFGINDCANFMSQGLYAGGEVLSTTWTPYTMAWDNADSHHDFFALGMRGADNPGANYLTYGDLIYYDWPAPYSGQYKWDHVVMVTGFDQFGTPYVSMHSPELGLVNWQTWPAPWLVPYSNAFTSVFTTYSY